VEKETTTEPSPVSNFYQSGGEDGEGADKRVAIESFSVSNFYQSGGEDGEGADKRVAIESFSVSNFYLSGGEEDNGVTKNVAKKSLAVSNFFQSGGEDGDDMSDKENSVESPVNKKIPAIIELPRTPKRIHSSPAAQRYFDPIKAKQVPQTDSKPKKRFHASHFNNRIPFHARTNSAQTTSSNEVDKKWPGSPVQAVIQPGLKRQKLSKDLHSFHFGLELTDTDLLRKRFESQQRLMKSFESIFEKYSHPFDDEGDVIDFETNEIIVDNGFIRRLDTTGWAFGDDSNIEEGDSSTSRDTTLDPSITDGADEGWQSGPEDGYQSGAVEDENLKPIQEPLVKTKRPQQRKKSLVVKLRKICSMKNTTSLAEVVDLESQPPRQSETPRYQSCSPTQGEHEKNNCEQLRDTLQDDPIEQNEDAENRPVALTLIDHLAHLYSNHAEPVRISTFDDAEALLASEPPDFSHLLEAVHGSNPLDST
jgi:hypothetical protein